MPPLGLAVIDPVLPPLQPILLINGAPNTNAVGWVTVSYCTTLQLLASLTVTLSIPADKLLMVFVVLPLFQLYTYGPVVPVVVNTILPSLNPLHVTSVIAGLTVNTGETVTTAEALAVQALALVAVTV